MSARERILTRVRAGATRQTPAPGTFVPTASPAPTWEHFAAAARAAGSEPHGPCAAADLARRVDSIAESWGGGRIVVESSAAALLGAGRWQVAAPDASPHSFGDVDIAVARARICVAENGALGIPAPDAIQRSLLFLCQRLILLAPTDGIVADMHAGVSASVDDTAHGPCFTWIAGPSKTADIEQHLVTGAHGPRALAIIGHSASQGEPGR